MMHKNTCHRKLQKRSNPHRPIEGMMLSNVSRGVNNRRNVGRTKARNTVAAAFIPGVLENISMVSPKKKAHNINSFREVPEANFKMK